MQDLSDITPEEALQELEARKAFRAQQQMQQNKQSGESIPKRLFSSQKDWLSGLGRGLGQSLGDIGASIGNLPAEAWEKLGHQKPYNIPHPDLLSKEPMGLSEAVAQYAGESLPKIGFEALIARRLAPLAGRNALPRIGAATAGGALAGGAASEDNRLRGLMSGALTGAGQQALSEFPLFRGQAAAPYKQVERQISKNGIGGFYLEPGMREEALEYLSQPGLGPRRLALERLMQGTQEGQYKPMHELQSNLGQIASELSRGQGAERLLAQDVKGLRQRIQSSIRKNLQEQGREDLASKLQRGQDLYRRHKQAEPHINDLIRYLLKGSALGTGGLIGYNILKK